jgi:hypothetical protein
MGSVTSKRRSRSGAAHLQVGPGLFVELVLRQQIVVPLLNNLRDTGITELRLEGRLVGTFHLRLMHAASDRRHHPRSTNIV